MPITDMTAVRSAEIVLPCGTLDETLAYLTERLGFRLEVIFPADDPAVAVIAGHGLRLRLDRAATGDPGIVRLLCDDPATIGDGSPLVAPNGTRIELAVADPPPDIPPLIPALIVGKADRDEAWVTGRAGMRYRDLIPGRLGGRFIASHIRIPDGGQVPDMVHYHRVRFQMIYRIAGWVRVVYQDQGGPMVMRAGDCFLQPPGIRHRVLESSPGLEVLEIGCPAEHPTLIDHDMDLPTKTLDRDRDFGGQRFVFFQAENAKWQPWRSPGFEACDLGIDSATDGLAGVTAIRRRAGGGPVVAPPMAHDAEFLFYFVRNGTLVIEAETHGWITLTVGDSVTIPAALPFAHVDASDDLDGVEIALPAKYEIA